MNRTWYCSAIPKTCAAVDRFWTGADLVVEVVSPDDPSRDFVQKRGDYAEAGIPEYWIVEPGTETITVLTLAGGTYVERGVFDRSTHAVVGDSRWLRRCR